MTKLPTPLRRVLDDGSDEATRQRLWRGIQARRQPGASRTRPLMRLAPALALATVAAVAIGWWVSRERSTPTPHAAVAPLSIAGGQPVGALLQATADEPLTVRLSDGSRVVLSARARLELAENGGATVSWVLRDGTVRFVVHKGGGRRWVVVAGLATVEVTGTQFTVSRRADAVSVAVHEGSVRVTSDRLEPATQILRAGQRLTVTAPAPAAGAVSDEPVLDATPGPAATGAQPSSMPAVPGRDGAAPVSVRRALAETDPVRAWELLGPESVEHESRTSTDPGTLLALADVARRSGHPREAVAPLRRVVQEFPGDRRAGIAAFTLGRLQLGSLGDPAGAAASFERALQLGTPASLRESAHARLVEAWKRAGDIGRAQHWASEYRRLFPGGPHAAQVDRWVAP